MSSKIIFIHSEPTIFLRYAEYEIPLSFPYRDMGTIRELYRKVMEIILGFFIQEERNLVVQKFRGVYAVFYIIVLPYGLSNAI